MIKVKKKWVFRLANLSNALSADVSADIFMSFGGLEVTLKSFELILAIFLTGMCDA